MSILNQIQNKTYSIFDKGWIIPNLNELEKYFDIKENTPTNEIGQNLKLKPYSYQKEAIEFCLKQEKALLVLPCGSGGFLKNCRSRIKDY